VATSPIKALDGIWLNKLISNQRPSSQETAKFIKVDKTYARKRAEKLVSVGLGVADAAHLVFAEAVEADFITCDDKLCKKCRTLDLAIWAGNPVAFCDKEGLR